MEASGIIADLLAFLDTLPQGFGCGPREQMAVRELVLRLIDGGEKLDNPARLKTLIAPLVCGDRDQQQEFYDRFAEWIAPQVVVEAPRDRPKRHWPVVVAAALVVGGIVGGGFYYFGPGPKRPAAAPAKVASADVKPEPNKANQVRGVVRTQDGRPLGNATVWVPVGIGSPQYPKVVTDAGGAFTIDLAPGQDSVRTQAQAPLVVQVDRTARSVVFSPDGTRLAAGSESNTVRVWDAASGRIILSWEGHTGTVYGAALSPDGSKLATGGEDKTAKIWDANTGKEILKLDEPDWVLSVAFSPDGTRLATACDKTAVIFDVAKGTKLLTLRGHTEVVVSVKFSPDGTRLATVSDDHTAKIWDAATGNEILTLRGHADNIWAEAFSPDGTKLATASNDKTAKIWDAATGQEILTMRGHTDKVSAIAFSPDGRTIATGSYDKTAKIWDAVTGKTLLTLRGDKDGLISVAFSPDGRRLATTSFDHTVRIWDLSSLYPSLPDLNLLITHADYEPAYIEHAQRMANMKLGPLKVARRVLTYTPNPPPRPRRYPRWVSISLALIPLCAAVFLFLRQRQRDRQRQAFLDQWETHLDFEPVRVHTRSEEEDLFQGAEVATLARELRRRRPEPTSQLAIDATVRNTAARAGLFTPVRRQRHGAREYLVLLESKGGRDQQASMWSCLLDRLAAREVWIDRYSFSGDPRVCEDPKSDRVWLRLEEISSIHPRHELWIVSAAGRFFNPTTRQPAPWVPALARWSDRAVLSLTDGSAEDREQLTSLGFNMTQASIAGVAGLNSDVVQAPKQAVPAPYPLLLEDDESRWLQGPEPSAESGARELRSLDRQLRAWLGGDGYRCLLACAVYPGLAWNLTLHLALALIPAAERETTLARLVRLPWFRHGRMPQWLRAFFTEKLDPNESARVTNLLREFLNRKAAPATGSSSGLEFAKPEIAPEMRAQGKPPTRDYVFLSFLLGRKARLQDLEAPAWLRRLLYPEGLPVLGLRRELWLAAGLLASGLVYGSVELFSTPPQPRHVQPAWHEVTPPPAQAAAPANDLSARALEIAEARVGQPADPQFASAAFDQAARFGAGRGGATPRPAQPGALFVPKSADGLPAVVEQVTADGLVMIESFQGTQRRVFRRTNDLVGVFDEIAQTPSTERFTRNVPDDVASLRKEAEAGNTDSMVRLGSLYETGRGVPVDYAQAVNWYRKAADSGNALGMAMLGTMYQTGRGVIADFSQALNWYRKAADSGNTSGMFMLGSMYEFGEGVLEDYDQALNWYRKAADRGYSRAMTRLGNMYATGRGVPEDINQATIWYRKAAALGDPDAQKALKGLKGPDSSPKPTIRKPSAVIGVRG